MFAVIDSVSTAIDVYQVGWDVKPRDGISKHVTVQFKSVPIGLAYLVPTFLATAGGKVKRTINISAHVG